MSKADFIQQWQVEGTVLSPVHIGSGESLDPFRIVQRGDTVHEFDLSQVLADANPNDRGDLEKRLAEKTVNPDEVLKLLRSMVKENHYLRGRSFKLAPSSQLKTGMSGQEIKLFSYNTLTGQRIIPGSSLKGAMRTGIVAERAKGKQIQTQDNQRFQQAAMGYYSIPEDPFGEWFFHDTVVDTKSVIIAVKTHHMNGKPTPPIPDLFETIPEGTYFTAFISHRRKDKTKGRFNLNDFLRAVNNNTKRAFDLTYPESSEEEEFQPESFPDETFNYEGEIYAMIEESETNKDQCVVRLGRFSGFLAMTVEEQRKLEKRGGGWLYGKEANPLTRVLTSDGWPFGFVKLKFTEI